MKRNVFSKKAIALILAALLIAPLILLLSGCGEGDKSAYTESPLFEGMRLKTLMRSSGKTLGLEAIASEALVQSIGRRYGEGREITLHGESHKAISGFEEVMGENYASPIASALCENGDGTTYTIKYTQDTNELCELQMPYLYGKRTPAEPELDRAKAAAEDYINAVLNGKYGKGIVLSDYALTSEKAEQDYFEFVWEKEFRGVTVHSVKVCVNGLYAACAFSAYPMPSDDILNSLYDIEPASYRDFAKYMIKAAESNAEGSVNYVYSEIEGADPELIYLHAYGDYYVRFKAGSSVRSENTSTFDSITFYTALSEKREPIPLSDYENELPYPMPENEYDFKVDFYGNFQYEDPSLSDAKITNVNGKEDEYVYSRTFYIEGTDRLCDFYSVKNGPTIKYDRELEKLISFSYSNLKHNPDALIDPTQAENLLSEFMKNNFPEIDFSKYTLCKAKQDDETFCSLEYEYRINGFTVSTLKAQYTTNLLWKFDLIPFTADIEIPAFDDETLLLFALDKLGEKKLIDAKISRGRLVYDLVSNYYSLRYDIDYRTVTADGGLSEVKHEDLSLPIARITKEDGVEFRFEHGSGYSSSLTSRAELFENHTIPNEDLQFDDNPYYKDFVKKPKNEFLDFEINGKSFNLKFEQIYTSLNNPEKSYADYTFTNRKNGKTTVRVDLESGTVLDFFESNIDHNQCKPIESENEALEIALDFLERYRIGFDRDDYQSHVYWDEYYIDDLLVTVYSLRFTKQHNGILTEEISMELCPGGDLINLSISSSPYTDKAPANPDALLYHNLYDSLMPYLKDVEGFERVSFRHIVTQYVYLDKIDAYAVQYYVYVLLYSSLETDLDSPTAYIPLTLYYTYDE